MRLVGGPTNFEGRLEVWRDGVWGTVCSNNYILDRGSVSAAKFDSTAAAVACKQLGLGSLGVAVLNATSAYGKATGMIWLANVKCVLGDS